MLNPNDIIHKFKLHLLFKIQVKTAPSTHKVILKGFQLAMVSRIDKPSSHWVSPKLKSDTVDKCFMTLHCMVNDAVLMRWIFTVMQTLDFFSGLHNCLEFSQPLEFYIRLCKDRKFIYLYVLTTILNFSCEVFNSFVICKTVSKLAVIYAPSLCHLC